MAKIEIDSKMVAEMIYNSASMNKLGDYFLAFDLCDEQGRHFDVYIAYKLDGWSRFDRKIKKVVIDVTLDYVGVTDCYIKDRSQLTEEEEETDGDNFIDKVVFDETKTIKIFHDIIRQTQ